MKASDPMPLYPDEERIALEVLGPARAKEWPRLAVYLEQKHRLPPVDELMGGRYWPSVKLCFDLYHGIANIKDAPTISGPAVSDRIKIVAPKPDGRENFDAEKAQSIDRFGGARRHRRAGLSPHRAG